MKSTGPLNSSSDTGFRPSPATTANGKSTIGGSERDSFSAALERVVGSATRGPGVRKPRNAAVEAGKPEKPEIKRMPHEESSRAVGKPPDSVLISDCSVSPGALRIPEAVGQKGCQHSGDSRSAAEEV